ncbi:MAG: glycosyltransferase family 2 protein [Herbiconiux sp.]|uniref:glycosyltransferase family 2 protein n=1 Tax=Herbiconiux sp. TaxID=1871186 RepID=UPI0011F965E2|nr:glycosyltransferase family 2 protein [Herbiconiux sp.]TAJ49312.1 MAG: glycosyltransferase family 2 protein [Herbiconiux sp.]
MSASVAVVIVTHHSHDLPLCLASIPGASTSPTLTVVVDNATSDDSVRTVMAENPEAVFIETGENLGYGRAVNRAVETLGPEIEWILVTNPDTVFGVGAIDTLMAVGESDPRIGSVGPRITNSDGSVYPSARSLPSLRTGTGHALFSRVWPTNPWTARYLRSSVYKRPGSDPVPAGWLSGACVLVRRTAFTEIGGFDPRYFMYFEDVDLGKSLGEAGWSNIYAPAATVEHAGGSSTARYSRRMLIAHHSSAALYLSKKYSAWYFWPLRTILRMSLFVRARLKS